MGCKPVKLPPYTNFALLLLAAKLSAIAIGILIGEWSLS
jgi:hypothetical protein